MTANFNFWLITSLIAVLFLIVGWLISIMHKQAMGKLDKIVEVTNALVTGLALHDEKLLVGSKEFEKIAAHQKEQDTMLRNQDKRISILESK